MNAGAQDLFGFPHMRVGELRQREIGLHCQRTLKVLVPGDKSLLTLTVGATTWR
jgi:hypothetical protein